MRLWPLLVLLAGCDLVFTVNVKSEPGQIIFTQTNSTDTKPGALNQTRLLSPTSEGNLLIVAVDWSGLGVNFVSIDDTAHDAFELAAGEVNEGDLHARLYYAENIAGGDSTVTIVLSGESPSLEVYVHEYTGVATDEAFDNGSQAHDAFGGDVTTGGALLDSPRELVFGFGVSGSVTPGDGFIARSVLNSNLTEDLISGEPGAYAATATASGRWTLLMAGFRAAPAR